MTHWHPTLHQPYFTIYLYIYISIWPYIYISTYPHIHISISPYDHISTYLYIGNCSFQQLPWCANIDGVGVWTQSGQWFVVRVRLGLEVYVLYLFSDLKRSVCLSLSVISLLDVYGWLLCVSLLNHWWLSHYKAWSGSCSIIYLFLFLFLFLYIFLYSMSHVA